MYLLEKWIVWSNIAALFQFWLTITKAFSPFDLEETSNYWSVSAWWAYGLVNSHAVSQLIMRVHKPKVEYKLVHLLPSP